MNLDDMSGEAWTGEDEVFALVSDYVFGEMRAEERRAFEERMDGDLAFRALAGPLVRALCAPRRELISEGEVERAWKRFAHENNVPTISAAARAEELLRMTVEQMRMRANGPEDGANRPRAGGSVPTVPLVRKKSKNRGEGGTGGAGGAGGVGGGH